MHLDYALMNTSMINISQYMRTSSQKIQNHLESLLCEQDSATAQLFAAARYALQGGKHVRPILALTTVELMGGNVEQGLSAICALECIHTYSMIHDDLPCMDNDDYRRGRLTVHRQFTEGHAVLTGDFLLTYAFEILARDEFLTAEQKVQLMHSLAYHSGAKGMIGGQIMDLASQNQSISIETLNDLHNKKTGALITAALEFGAIISNATEHERVCLSKFGAAIGLTFQIIDDILDVTESEAKHGRSVSSDIVNGKATYVSLLGIEQAQICANHYYQQALQALAPLKQDVSNLISLADFILHRKH